MKADNNLRLPELTCTPTCLGDCRDYVRAVMDSNADTFVKMGQIYTGQDALSDEVLADRIHAYVSAALSELTAHISKIPKGFDHGLATAGFLSDTVLSSPQLLRESTLEGTLAERSYIALSSYLRDVAGRRVNELLDDQQAGYGPGTLTFEECVACAKKLIGQAYRNWERIEKEDKGTFAEDCKPEACAEHVLVKLEIDRHEAASVVRSEPEFWLDTPPHSRPSLIKSIFDVIKARLVEVAKEEIAACEGARAEASSSQAEPPALPSP